MKYIWQEELTNATSFAQQLETTFEMVRRFNFSQKVAFVRIEILHSPTKLMLLLKSEFVYGSSEKFY